mmetsp:Transcript_22144/g.56898  ORF Transcript_22144/g.56898 Transcript_22144/m.56898 type:complete len:281 (-) Transcript_22144:104-946(-)
MNVPMPGRSSVATDAPSAPATAQMSRLIARWSTVRAHARADIRPRAYARRSMAASTAQVAMCTRKDERSAVSATRPAAKKRPSRAALRLAEEPTSFSSLVDHRLSSARIAAFSRQRRSVTVATSRAISSTAALCAAVICSSVMAESSRSAVNMVLPNESAYDFTTVRISALAPKADARPLNGGGAYSFGGSATAGFAYPPPPPPTAALVSGVEARSTAYGLSSGDDAEKRYGGSAERATAVSVAPCGPAAANWHGAYWCCGVMKDERGRRWEVEAEAKPR